MDDADPAEDAVARAVRRLAAGVVHELNNPLTVLQLRADLLLEAPVEAEDLREQLAVLRTSVARIAAVVRVLRWLGRPRPVVRAPAALGALVRQAAGAVDGEVRVEALPAVVLPCDAEALGFALELLLRAALDYDPPTVRGRVADGRIEVVVAAPSAPWPAQAIAPDATLEASSRWPGLGLGLAAGILAAHGGGLTSAPGVLVAALAAA
ncbi:MAG: histidine kinase dimerization/phospho-acceptor domain-containing protein [Myxococcota bacterium]